MPDNPGKIAPNPAELATWGHAGQRTLADVPAPAGALHPGLVLDERYRLCRLIGQGAMGQVWEAEHLHLGNRVAIKLLADELRSQPSNVARFHREAKIAGGLGHPNVVAVLDVSGPGAPLPYLALELLSGKSLKFCAGEAKRLALAEAIEVVEQVLLGLEAAHAKGIVHRDIKPENIMLLQGSLPGAPKVKLLDFGISTFADGSMRMTRTGALMGTPLYMAPEQIETGKADERSDLYAVGVLFYELITGELPFVAETLPALLMRISSGAPRPLREFLPTVSPELQRFCSRALARDPGQRFASAKEMRAAVLAIPQGDETVKPEESLSAYLSALGEIDESSLVGVDGAAADQSRPHLPTLLPIATSQRLPEGGVLELDRSVLAPAPAVKTPSGFPWLKILVLVAATGALGYWLWLG